MDRAEMIDVDAAGAQSQISCDAFTVSGRPCAAKGRRALWSDGVRYTVCTRHANFVWLRSVVRFPVTEPQRTS